MVWSGLLGMGIVVTYSPVKTNEQHNSGASGVFLKTSLSQVPHVLREPKGGVDNSFAAPGVSVLLFPSCGSSPDYSMCRLKVAGGDWLLFLFRYHLPYACSCPTLFPVFGQGLSDQASQSRAKGQWLGYDRVIFSTLCITFPIYKWKTKACLMCRQLDNMVQVCKVHGDLWMQILNYS